MAEIIINNHLNNIKFCLKLDSNIIQNFLSLFILIKNELILRLKIDHFNF